MAHLFPVTRLKFVYKTCQKRFENLKFVASALAQASSNRRETSGHRERRRHITVPTGTPLKCTALNEILTQNQICVETLSINTSHTSLRCAPREVSFCPEHRERLTNLAHYGLFHPTTPSTPLHDAHQGGVLILEQQILWR